jgi:hypothetical protein
MGYKIKGVDILNDSAQLVNSVYVRVLNTNGHYAGVFSASSPLQGTTTGFISGGNTSPSATTDTVGKISFASANTNSTSHSTLTVSRGGVQGQSSEVSGYTSGGVDGSFTAHDTIDKFAFASTANATDVGNLTGAGSAFASQSSADNGYLVGVPNVQIQKFPFAADANSVLVGTLTTPKAGSAGHSSITHGYISGSLPAVNIIEKFPFGIEVIASDVGDLVAQRDRPVGQSSEVSGYASGGSGGSPPAPTNTIQKFPFAADANATDISDLTVRATAGAGISSVSFGYIAGGFSPFGPAPTSSINVISRFPFSSDANAVDVGDLAIGFLNRSAGQQD